MPSPPPASRCCARRCDRACRAVMLLAVPTTSRARQAVCSSSSSLTRPRLPGCRLDLRSAGLQAPPLVAEAQPPPPPAPFSAAEEALRRISAPGMRLSGSMVCGRAERAQQPPPGHSSGAAHQQAHSAPSTSCSMARGVRVATAGGWQMPLVPLPPPAVPLCSGSSLTHACMHDACISLGRVLWLRKREITGSCDAQTSIAAAARLAGTVAGTPREGGGRGFHVATRLRSTRA